MRESLITSSWSRTRRAAARSRARAPGRTRNGVEQRWVFAEAWVVHHGCDLAPVALENRDCPPSGWCDIDVLSVDVGVVLGFGEPVAKFERGLTQRAGKRVFASRSGSLS